MFFHSNTRRFYYWWTNPPESTTTFWWTLSDHHMAVEEFCPIPLSSVASSHWGLQSPATFHSCSGLDLKEWTGATPQYFWKSFCCRLAHVWIIVLFCDSLWSKLLLLGQMFSFWTLEYFWSTDFQLSRSWSCKTRANPCLIIDWRRLCPRLCFTAKHRYFSLICPRDDAAEVLCSSYNPFKQAKLVQSNGPLTNFNLWPVNWRPYSRDEALAFCAISLTIAQSDLGVKLLGCPLLAVPNVFYMSIFGST